VPLSHVLSLSLVMPCSSTMKLSSLHLVIFKYPYLIDMKSNSGNFSAMNSTHHFVHIYRLYFHMKKILFPFQGKVETLIHVSDPYLHPIKIPIPVIMAPKYKEHGSCSRHSRNTCKELLLVERQLT
jgi:hypothetical protein